MIYSKKTVAILGATSHIAKGLIFFLKDDESIELHLYARNLVSIRSFLNLINYKNPILRKFSELGDDSVDIIINCIGIVNRPDFKSPNENIFELTEKFDHLVLDYLWKNEETRYINFSSGAVCGTSFDDPASKVSRTSIDVNNIITQDYYRIAKLNSEAKHRSLNCFKIIDLRIFGYYSRFIDLTKTYLMTDIILCVKEKRVLKTNINNIIRDYIHPADLAGIIKACFDDRIINQVFDVKSKKSISKMEILKFFEYRYNLKFELVDNFKGQSLTGQKLNYFSENNDIENIGYISKYTSFDCIKMETEALFDLNS